MALKFGVEPVHFGIIMVVNLALGMITPPFGVNLFAACAVAKLPLERLIKPLILFVGVVIVCLMVITYWPGLSLGLRDVVYGSSASRPGGRRQRQRKAPDELTPRVGRSAKARRPEFGIAPGSGL